jgi:hypothetical protein
MLMMCKSLTNLANRSLQQNIAEGLHPLGLLAINPNKRCDDPKRRWVRLFPRAELVCLIRGLDQEVPMSALM